MSYTFEWIVPDRVLKAEIPFKFDDELARAFDRDMITYLDAASQPLQLIVDLRQTRVHPSLSTFLGWKQFKHPRFGQAILVGMSASPIVRFLTTMLMKIMGIRLSGAATVEEATAILSVTENTP
jgi:hypothetical protein